MTIVQFFATERCFCVLPYLRMPENFRQIKTLKRLLANYCPYLITRQRCHLI